MKINSGRIIGMIVAALFLRQALAAKHAVGGSQGWDESTDFDSWASAQTFKVGDELEFKYSSLHNVVELPSESAFKSCDVGAGLNSLNGGDSKVKLDKVGTRYFACGTTGHCEQGMKVKITTVAADASPAAGTSATPAVTTQSSAASRHHVLSFFAFVASLMAFVVLV